MPLGPIVKYKGNLVTITLGRWVVSKVHRGALHTRFTMQKVDDASCRFDSTVDTGCSLQVGDILTIFSMLPVEKQ
jgi:hypothetical protein